MVGARKADPVSPVIVPLLVTAALLAILMMLTIWTLTASSGQLTRGVEVGEQRDISRGESVVPHDVALALLHFATTKEVPQQSREEIAATLGLLLQRAPCNFLVFGIWHDSLLWATFNYGGRTVFVDESQVFKSFPCS